MRKQQHHLVILCTLLGNMFVSGNVFAEAAGNPDTRQEQLVWVETIERNGFAGQVPTVDPLQLAEHIERLRNELLQHQQQFTRTVEETRLGAGDAVITAIMPGGLLYAGYRKRAHKLAKNNLATVTDDIEALTHDLEASRSLSSTVAQLD